MICGSSPWNAFVTTVSFRDAGHVGNSRPYARGLERVLHLPRRHVLALGELGSAGGEMLSLRMAGSTRRERLLHSSQLFVEPLDIAVEDRFWSALEDRDL